MPLSMEGKAREEFLFSSGTLSLWLLLLPCGQTGRGAAMSSFRSTRSVRANVSALSHASSKISLLMFRTTETLIKASGFLK